MAKNDGSAYTLKTLPLSARRQRPTLHPDPQFFLLESTGDPAHSHLAGCTALLNDSQLWARVAVTSSARAGGNRVESQGTRARDARFGCHIAMTVIPPVNLQSGSPIIARFSCRTFRSDLQPVGLVQLDLRL